MVGVIATFTRQHSRIDEIPSRFCAIFGSVKTRGFEGAPELLYKVTRLVQ